MRSSRLKQVFLAASSAPEESRAAILDRECEGDESLRAEVELLLSREAAGPDFTHRLSLFPEVTIDGETGDAHQLLPGAVLGSYTIVRVLGAGGASCVYEASRAGLDRTVAIKVLSAPVSTPHSRWRFEHEVRSLSRLSHPAIVRVLDFGLSGSRAYLVMDLIPGTPRPFGEAARALGRRKALELLVEVCDAVSHAHKRGVIHRDLKSANVLVSVDSSDRPNPAIVDFGIARVFGTAAEAPPTQVTHAGLVLGTLGTLSPEQAAADPDAVDTRTDVWGLGVLAYEALTGELPHGRPGPGPAAMAEWLARVQTQECVPPAGLDPSVPPDLNAIVVKALARRRESRYPSAEAMADDIRRFLRGEPTSVRPPGRIEAAFAWLRRHRKLAATSAVAGVLVIATVLSAARARSAESEALRRSVKGNLYLLEEIVALAAEREGTRDFRENLLDWVQARVAEDVRTRPEDDGARRTLAVLWRRRGELYLESGRPEEAIHAFETARAEILGLHEPSGEANVREIVAATVRVGDAHSAMGDSAAMISWYRRAQALLETESARSPDSLGLLNDLCWGLERLAAFEPDPAKCGEVRNRRLAIARDMHRRDPQSAPVLHNLVDALHMAQSPDSPPGVRMELATEACAMAESLMRMNPKSRLFRRLDTACRSDRVLSLLECGRKAEALSESEAVWNDALAAVREDSRDQFALEGIFHACVARTACLKDAGAVGEARRVYEHAVAVLSVGVDAGVGGYVRGSRDGFLADLSKLDSSAR